MTFEFLRALKLVDTTGIRQPEQKAPEGGLIIRIFKNGEVYPSNELITAHNLSYKKKNEEDKGNGYDVVPSWKWPPTANLEERFIMIALVGKNESKVDLFSRTTYNDNGTPKSDVISQGSKCEELLEACKELGYFGEHTRYVDLKIHVEVPVTTEDGIYLFPKVIEKGEHKGKLTYERRENISVYPISSIFKKDVTPKPKKEKQTEEVAVEKNELVTNITN